MNISSTQ